MSRGIIEVELLLEPVNKNAQQAEQRHEGLEAEIQGLKERLLRSDDIGRRLRNHKANKSSQFKELVKTARTAANYASKCSEGLQQLTEHNINAEFAMAAGALWECYQQEFSNKSMALQRME